MTDESPDRLAGREQDILDSLFKVVYPKAKEGDENAIDRVLKILDMKRRYRRDRYAEESD